MIAFRDFVPAQTQPPGFFTTGQYALIDQAVQTANEWIRQAGAQVLSVETVVLPNMNKPGEEGTGDAMVRTTGDMTSYWFQFVRVWYSAE